MRLAMFRHIRRSWVIMGSCVAAAAGAVLLAQGGTVGSATSSSAPQGAAKAEYSVLQRGASSQDGLPSQADSAQEARRIATGSNVNQWITLSGTKVCVVVSGSDPVTQGVPSACGELDQMSQADGVLIGGWAQSAAAAGGSGASVTPSFWAGIAPNGVRSISVGTSDGANQTVPVAENGFHFASGGKAVRRFSWIAGDGRPHTVTVTAGG